MILSREHDTLAERDFGILLFIRRGSKPKNPSDLIYSLLGVASSVWKSTISPDYQKSFQVVFSETTAHIIRVNGKLNILSQVDYTLTPTFDLPTWVPDWRQAIQAGGHMEFSVRTDLSPVFRSSGSSKPVFQLSSDVKQQILRGLFLDVISSKIPQAFGIRSMGLGSTKLK